MFRPGKVLKVKVELSPDVVGFGRATIVESEGSRIFLQLRTSKGEKRNLPKGTKVWFVSDSAESPFNGLWSTTIVNSKMIGGKTALECTRPKFEAAVQRRKHRRVAVSCPVRVHGDKFDRLHITTRNVSRSGIGLEANDDCTDDFPSGHHFDLNIDSPIGPIQATARVIQARYNWLANRTDVGLEFVKVEQDAVLTLDRLLVAIGGQPRFAPEGKEGRSTGAPGQLSGWLKSSKDNVQFVKAGETQGTTVLSAYDIEELAGDDDEDDEN